MALCVVGGAACAEPAPDPADELAGRVRAALTEDRAEVAARLDELGVPAVDVGGIDLRCPAVGDADEGDTATCTFTVGDQDVQVDVLFTEDGTLRVVAVAVVP